MIRVLLALFVIFQLSCANEHLKVGAAPTIWDWRTVSQGNTLTPVKDQYLCNSGWAHAAVAAYEQLIKRANGTEYDLSQEYLIQCSQLSNCTYEPKNLRRVMNFLADNGLPTEADVPYTSGPLLSGKASVPGACNKTRIWVPGVRSHGSYGLTWGGLRGDIVKGVSVCTFNATSRFKQYTGGIYSCTSDDAPLDIRETNHAVLAVGYRSDRNLIIKNSYGTAWGEGGYANIDYKNDCGMRIICLQLWGSRFVLTLLMGVAVGVSLL